MLNPHDPFMNCPKCGVGNVPMEFHRIHFEDRRCNGAGREEHLYRKCLRCGYWWIEATIDKMNPLGPSNMPEPQSAPPRAISIPGVSVPSHAMRIPGGSYPRGWIPPLPMEERGLHHVFTAIKEKNMLAGALLEQGRIARLEGNDLVFALSSPRFNQFHLDQLETPRHRGAVEAAMREAFGRDMNVKFILESSHAKTLPTPIQDTGGKPEKRKEKNYTQEVIDRQNAKFLERMTKKAEKKGKPGKKPKRHYTKKMAKKEAFPSVDKEAANGTPVETPTPPKDPVQTPTAPSSPANVSRAVELLRKKGANP